MAGKRKRTSAKSRVRNSSQKFTRVSKGRAKQAELERIEKLLGEDFDSLAQARKALKAETGAVPHKKSYKVTELSSRKHRTIRTLLPDMDEHSAEIDALKRPSDFWAARIYGHGTYKLFGTTGDLVKQLGTYKGLQDEHPMQALKNIDVIRVSGIDADKYFRAKQKEVKDRWEKRQAEHKEDRKRKRKQARKFKQLQNQIKSLKKQLRQK